jgi:peptidoglycan hydrolase CwlO-like protein
MTPDRENSMRKQLADYSMKELVDLNISLQDVIDDHIREKAGMTSSNEAMSQQIVAMRAELEKLEGTEAGDPEEIEKLQKEVDSFREKYETLRERFDKVQALNEKFQEKLLDKMEA